MAAPARQSRQLRAALYHARQRRLERLAEQAEEPPPEE